MYAEATALREKRSLINLTDSQKACLSKCPDCSSFESGDTATIARASKFIVQAK